MEKETTLVQPIVTGESAQAEGTPVPAEEFAARLASGELAECRVGLLHGRMKPKAER